MFIFSDVHFRISLCETLIDSDSVEWTQNFKLKEEEKMKIVLENIEPLPQTDRVLVAGDVMNLPK